MQLSLNFPPPSKPAGLPANLAALTHREAAEYVTYLDYEIDRLRCMLAGHEVTARQRASLRRLVRQHHHTIDWLRRHVLAKPQNSQPESLRGTFCGQKRETMDKPDAIRYDVPKTCAGSSAG